MTLLISVSMMAAVEHTPHCNLTFNIGFRNMNYFVIRKKKSNTEDDKAQYIGPHNFANNFHDESDEHKSDDDGIDDTVFQHDDIPEALRSKLDSGFTHNIFEDIMFFVGFCYDFPDLNRNRVDDIMSGVSTLMNRSMDRLKRKVLNAFESMRNKSDFEIKINALFTEHLDAFKCTKSEYQRFQIF